MGQRAADCGQRTLNISFFARSSGKTQEEAHAFGAKRKTENGEEEEEESWPEGVPGAAPGTLRQYSKFLLDKKKDPAGADKVPNPPTPLTPTPTPCPLPPTSYLRLTSTWQVWTDVLGMREDEEAQGLL
jgi:hypothetical protein